MTIWWKAPFWLVENQKKKRWKFRGFSSRTGRSRICSCVHLYTMDWPALVPGPTGVRPKFCLIRYITHFKIIFRVSLRVNGLVLPVVMTQCALRSKNTAYLPRVDRGRVTVFMKKFAPDPRFGTGGQIPSIQLFDLRRSESTATYCVPLPY